MLSRIKWLLGLLLIILTASLIHNDTYERSNLIPLLMMAIYTLFFFSLSSCKLRITAQWLERTENRILVFVLVIGTLQMLCKSGMTFLTEPLQLLIYNDVENTDVIFNYKDLTRFYSTFMEPSYCSAYLVGMFAAIIVRRTLTVRNILLCGLTGLAILLTRASTGFGGVAIILCLLLITRAKKKIFRIYVPLFIVAALYLFWINPDLVNEVIFDKINTSSFKTRNRLNELAFAAFMGSPILGIGFRNIRASSLLMSLLGEAGFLGFFVYLMLLLCVLSLALQKKTPNLTRQRSYFALGIMICQLIACPDLNFSPFWMALFTLEMGLKLDQSV